MNEYTEAKLREHLRAVDSVDVPLSTAVGDRVSRVERRIERRRRGLAAASAIATVALVVGVVWNTSASPQKITGADGIPSTTITFSTEASPTTIGQAGPWSAIPSFRKPTTGANVVWTGTEALMIGGTYPDGTLAGIDAYNPDTSQWRTVLGGASFEGSQLDFSGYLAFWTGTSLLLIGALPSGSGFELGDESAFNTHVIDAAAIDATVPWVWTGTELLVWPTAAEPLPQRHPRAFDPVTREWRVLAESPIEPRTDAASHWTGTEWIVWGGSRGSTAYADGAAYNPVTDTWRVLAASPLSARRAPAVWTGSEMIVTGGSNGDPNSPNALADGAAYDPLTDSWRTIAPGFGHPGFQPVWTGELVVLFAKGGAVWYDPLTDQWSTGDMNFGDVPHLDQSPVWTGEVVLLLGSYDGSTGGAVFTPPQT